MAGESIGEYVACSNRYYFFPDLRAELRSVDADLFRAVDRLMQQADDPSARMLAPTIARTLEAAC